MSCCSPEQKKSWYKTPFGRLALVFIVSLLISSWHDHRLNLSQLGVILTVSFLLFQILLNAKKPSKKLGTLGSQGLSIDENYSTKANPLRCIKR
jgi:hypothetical protein